MTEFQIGDIVKYRFVGKCGVGCVQCVTPKKVRILDLDNYEEWMMSKDCAQILPKSFINKETFVRFARYETTAEEVSECGYWQNIVNAEGYQITLEDLLCVLEKVISQSIDSITLSDEWFCYFDEVLENSEAEGVDNSFYNRNTVMTKIGEELRMWVLADIEPDLSAIVKEVHEFLEDENKPLTERRFPDYAKLRLLRMLDSDGALSLASEDEVLLYKRFAEDLCRSGNVEGLEAVCYGCYGGNRAFLCDWERSEECLLQLFEKNSDTEKTPLYANTLGYIYYYGRTTAGVPNYEAAYKYFSFAAFSGVYEAQYKIADMYKNGYGVIKNLNTAKHIVALLYYENLEYIQKGIFDSKFADIAFRLGNYCKDDEDIYESYFDEMLRCYYQARFAIRMRMLEKNYYGDEKVAVAIENALNETKQLIDFKPQKKYEAYYLNYIFEDCFRNGRKIDVKVTEMANRKFKLVFSAHKNRDTYYDKLFITIPELDMCGLYDKITVTAVLEDDGYLICGENDLVIDDMDTENFFYDGVPVLVFGFCRFEIKRPKSDEKIHRFVSVCFSPNGHKYDYLCDDKNIKIGDVVSVKANNEVKDVTVVDVFEKTESETSLPIRIYKSIPETTSDLK